MIKEGGGSDRGAATANFIVVQHWSGSCRDSCRRTDVHPPSPEPGTPGLLLESRV